ncbi:hypothetical protein PH213_30385 [Streptomyces sp. SRF1]|nr:hypothetical protein [Streptomyces sp. SRF1]MDN3058779.1 hypothetical protein [Streptomyces sp. SRF1]
MGALNACQQRLEGEGRAVVVHLNRLLQERAMSWLPSRKKVLGVRWKEDGAVENQAHTSHWPNHRTIPHISFEETFMYGTMDTGSKVALIVVLVLLAAAVLRSVVWLKNRDRSTGDD